MIYDFDGYIQYSAGPYGSLFQQLTERILSTVTAWVDIPYTERMQHTSSAEASGITLIYGPVTLSVGDVLRAVAKFSASDVGSNWLAEKCSISIFKV